jgi:hypothetical protein
MRPQELASDIQDELADALIDLELPQRLSVIEVVPPDQLDAESCLYVTLASADGTTASLELPSSLAVGYLADEEAAVDEWRLWIQEIAARLVP